MKSRTCDSLSSATGGTGSIKRYTTNSLRSTWSTVLLLLNPLVISRGVKWLLFPRIGSDSLRSLIPSQPLYPSHRVF